MRRRATTSPRSDAARKRLRPADWVAAGFRTLAQSGAHAVGVDALARELGATKGSFYWHFDDLAALKSAMLQAWEQLATTDITAAVRSAPLAPQDRLFLLMEKVSVTPGDEFGGLAIEPAIREWGRAEPLARAAVERVDRQRLADLRDFLRAAGLAPLAISQAAVVIYAAVIGLESLRLSAGVGMREPLLALVEQILTTAPRADTGAD
ncbi:MAG: TetR/AcrR family transcriptional regulator [Burkholderiales bacterium]|nr:TetR/AcrR family transcriptional regulator [Burkholderiales bacterium]